MNNRFVSLMYHSLGEKPKNQYDVSLETFFQQVKKLVDSKYIIESFDQCYNRILTRSIPPNYVVLSFDDGYQSFTNAADILESFNIRGTFFLSKDWCDGKEGFLSSKEIYSISCRHEVGSHSVTHPNFSKLSANDIRSELTESKNWLEDVSNNKVISFSFPGGFYTEQSIRIAKEVGYKIVGNSIEWWNNDTSPKLHPFVINRIAIRKQFNPKLFNQIISLNTGFYLKRKVRSSLLSIPKKLFGKYL